MEINSFQKNTDLIDFSTEKVRDTEWWNDNKPYVEAGFRKHTSSGESHFLFKLASKYKGRNIAEIGTMHGGNTAVLGWGLEEGRLVSVDLFELHPLSDVKKAIETPNRLLEYFRLYLPKVDLKIFKDDSSTLGKRINHRFDLVFLDGDHSYEGVKKDWESWSNTVNKNGTVVFHDCHIDGVNKVISEIDSNKWKFERQIFTMKSFIRIS